MIVLLFEEVLRLHDMVLAWGGLDGIPRAGRLEAALGAAENWLSYNEDGDAVDFAACVLWYVVKGHPFPDGNKRTAWLSCVVVLESNGIQCVGSQQEVIAFVDAIAAGAFDLGTTREFLRARCTGAS